MQRFYNRPTLFPECLNMLIMAGLLAHSRFETFPARVPVAILQNVCWNLQLRVQLRSYIGFPFILPNGRIPLSDAKMGNFLVISRRPAKKQEIDKLKSDGITPILFNLK